MRACFENLEEMGTADFGGAVHPFCSHLIVLICHKDTDDSGPSKLYLFLEEGRRFEENLGSPYFCIHISDLHISLVWGSDLYYVNYILHKH